MSEYNISEAIKLQNNFCKKNSVPLFIPQSGHCTRCGKNIFSKDGYTVKQAASQLITGCSFCGNSFCE